MEQWQPQPAEPRRDEAPEETPSALPNPEDHTRPSEEPELPLTAETTRQNESLHENPRIDRLMQNLLDSERQLKDALTGLEQREKSPSFQKAKELFEEGWRFFLDSDEDTGRITLTPFQTGDNRFKHGVIRLDLEAFGDGKVQVDEEFTDSDTLELVKNTIENSFLDAKTVKFLTELTQEQN